MVDQVANFKKVTVSTGYNNTATSIVLATGQGAELPDPSGDNYNLVWWDSTNYNDPADDPNVEIVRVTAKSTDTLTVTRNQEGSGASNKNNADATYKMILPTTAKTITDLIAVEKCATVIVGKSGEVDYLTTDYGSDDACVQAAIDYVEGLGDGNVLIREGTFTFSTAVTIPTGVSVSGVGRGTIITPGADVFMFNMNEWRNELKNIKILGNRTTGKGITMGSASDISHCRLSNIQIESIPDYAIYAKRVHDSFWYDIQIVDCGTATEACVKLDSDVTDGCTNIKWFGGTIAGLIGTGLHLSGNSETTSNVRRHVFTGLQIHGDLPTPVAGIDAIVIDGATYANNFIACNLHGHGGVGFRVTNGRSNNIQGCTIQYNTNGDIILTAGAKNTIDKCIMENPTGTYGVDANVSDTRITNNTFGIGGISTGLLRTGVRNIVQGNQFITSGTPITVNGNDSIISGNNFKLASGTNDINNGSRTGTIIKNNQIQGTIANIAGVAGIVCDNKGFNPVGNFTAPSVPATTVNYTNAYGYPCQVQVYGGTVSEIDIDDIATGLTAGIFIIPPGGTINITYSAAPSWRWWGL